MDDSASKPEAGAALPAAGAEPDSAAGAASLPGLRAWFAGYVLWMLALVGAARLAFDEYSAADTPAGARWLLPLGAFYLSLCNTLLPLPTAWVVLLLASHDVALFQSDAERIAAVALLGASATMMANLNEYHVLGYFLRSRLGGRIRQTHTYRWAVRWFDVAPFQTLALFAFLPIPVDFVRWLAILRRYPRGRFAAAYWIGRLPRYALLAGLSAALHLDAWEIALLQAALVVPLAGRWLLAAGRRSSRP